MDKNTYAERLLQPERLYNALDIAKPQACMRSISTKLLAVSTPAAAIAWVSTHCCTSASHRNPLR